RLDCWDTLWRKQPGFEVRKSYTHLEWWRAYYHFVRPHDSLRVALVQPRQRGATVWPNAISNRLRRWPPAEPTDDGRRARCSLAPCPRCALERHITLMREACYVASKSMKVPAKARQWGLASGKGGPSGLSTHKIP